MYNTFILQKEILLPEEYRTNTIQTLRWSLIGIAGKVVSLVGDLCFCLQLHGRSRLSIFRCEREEFEGEIAI